MNISQLMEVTLSFFTITICCFVSIFLLTTVQLETSKNEEQKRRLLNILYSHISILWQIDTLFCSAKVMIQVVSYVKDQDVQNIINQITDYDLEVFISAQSVSSEALNTSPQTSIWILVTNTMAIGFYQSTFVLDLASKL